MTKTGIPRGFGNSSSFIVTKRVSIRYKYNRVFFWFIVFITLDNWQTIKNTFKLFTEEVLSFGENKNNVRILGNVVG